MHRGPTQTTKFYEGMACIHVRSDGISSWGFRSNKLDLGRTSCFKRLLCFTKSTAIIVSQDAG